MGGGWSRADVYFDGRGRLVIKNAEFFELLRDHFNRTGEVIISQGEPHPDGGGGSPLPGPRPEPPEPPGPVPDLMCVCVLRMDKLNGWPIDMWEPDFHRIRSLGARPTPPPPPPPTDSGGVT